MIELGTKLTQANFAKGEAGGAGKKATTGGKDASFEERLSKALGYANAPGDVSQVVKVLSGEQGMNPPQEVAAISTQGTDQVQIKLEPEQTDVTQKVSDILGDVNDGQVKLQRLIDLVTSNTTLSPQELIAVQAGVFSLVQELELVGKATQEATQGVRQTLNTNVG